MVRRTSILALGVLVLAVALGGCGRQGYSDCILDKVDEGAASGAVEAVKAACREKAHHPASQSEVGQIALKHVEVTHRPASTGRMRTAQSWGLKARVMNGSESPLRKVDIDLRLQERLHAEDDTTSGESDRWMYEWSASKQQTMRFSCHVEPLSSGTCHASGIETEVQVLESRIVSAVLFVP